MGLPLADAVILPPSRPAEGRRNSWLRTRRVPWALPLICEGSKPRDARITVVSGQPAGFREFDGGAFGLAVEGVGSGEVTANGREHRSVVARPFEPDDRFVRARLQEVHPPD